MGNEVNTDSKRAVDAASNTSMFSFGGKGWRVMIFSMIIYFTCCFLANDSLNIYVPFLAEKGMESGTLYSFNTYAGWIAVPLTFIFSWLLRKSSKLCMAIGLICAIAGCMWFGAANHTWEILIIMILFQLVFNGTVFMGTSNLVANWFPTRKGGAMGWVTIGASLNTAANPWIWTILIGLLGAGVLGLGNTFRVWGVILVVLLIFLLVGIKNNPEEQGAFPDNDKSITIEEAQHARELGELYKKSSPWTVKKLLTCKEMWIIAIASGVIMMITTGIISNFVSITMSYGFSSTGALGMMSLASVIGAVFSVCWGKVDAVKGVKWACIVFYIIMAVAMILWLMPSVVTFFIGAIFVGCSLGAGNNLMASMTASIFGRYDFDKAWGVIYPIHVVIRSAGFGLVGVISSRTGSFKPAFAAMLVFAVVAIICVAFLQVRMLGRTHVDEADLQTVAEKK